MELWLMHVIFKAVEIAMIMVSFVVYAISASYGIASLGYWGPGPCSFVFLIILILCIKGLYIEFWEEVTITIMYAVFLFFAGIFLLSWHLGHGYYGGYGGSHDFFLAVYYICYCLAGVLSLGAAVTAIIDAVFMFLNR